MIADPEGWPGFRTELEEFQELRCSFPDFTLKYCRRGKNEKADLLAKNARLRQSEAKLLAAISERDKVAVISTCVPFSLALNKYDHFIQFTYDSTSEATGITKLIHDFNWRSIVDDWRESLQILVHHFQDQGIQIDRIVSFADNGEDYMSRRPVRNDGTWLCLDPHWSEQKSHDIACVLATAVEKIRVRESENVLDLLETFKQNRFKGLSHGGDIEIVGNKFLSGTFEIVNMVGTGERRIGLWTSGNFYGRRQIMVSSTNELETIIWPGGSGRIPRHRVLEEKGEKKKLLRVLVTSENRFPHLVAVRPDPETGLNTVSGFCIEVFMTCIAHLNYDGMNYDNLAYELSTQRDKYDAAVGDITITSNRSLYVDFTLPYTDLGIGALELKKKKDSLWTFFDPLEKSLWLASGAFFILTGIVVWLLERAVNPEFQGSWGQQIGMMLWFGFSTLVFANREKLQKMSSRFLVIVWVFVVVILTASYGANLTTTITVSRIQLNELIIGPARLRAARTRMLNTHEDYAQALRNGTIGYIVDEIPYLSVLGIYPGVFNLIARNSVTNGFGFMFQRGSGLASNVSREIASLRSSGMLEDIEKRWFQKLDSFITDQNIESPENDDASKRLTIQELGGLFIIAGVAHALVLAVHLFKTRQEILHVLQESRLFTKLQNFSGFYK
ncbi:hypothetical protein AALP_AAs74096U000400 [Arabis alpina]|uniref:Ionotropic glutamate receptor C-terminal domain-containing protein n=1 Tax=Arabis alpina TaxID=50452 RepID=A0A087G1K3_ARAAL|nr:hypothetical protein AALP_AAs74096U000400 [Arabis alpina]